MSWRWGYSLQATDNSRWIVEINSGISGLARHLLMLGWSGSAGTGTSFPRWRCLALGTGKEVTASDLFLFWCSFDNPGDINRQLFPPWLSGEWKDAASIKILVLNRKRKGWWLLLTCAGKLLNAELEFGTVYLKWKSAKKTICMISSQTLSAQKHYSCLLSLLYSQ